MRKPPMPPLQHLPLFVASFASCLWLWACGAPDTKEAPHRLTLLHGATLIDGTTAAAQENSFVILNDGRISQVGSGPPPSEIAAADTLDLTGKYLLPGFVNMHIHAALGELNPVAGTEGQQWHVTYDREAAHTALTMLLENGVTTAASLGGWEQALQLREAIERNDIQGPRLFSAGRLIDSPPSLWSGYVTEVQTAEELEEEIERQAAAGVDFIKLYMNLPPELVKAGVEESHRHSLPALGHMGATSWLQASEAGIDYLLHGFSPHPSLLPTPARSVFPQESGSQILYRWLEEMRIESTEMQALIESLRDRDVVVDLTLVAHEAFFWSDNPPLTDHPGVERLPARLLENWRQVRFNADWSAEDFKRAKQAFMQLLRLALAYHEAGVLLVAGTDLASPWIIAGVSFHRELQLLHRAGIPVDEVLRIATANAAKALGRLEEFGTVEVGKRADLVVLRANPFEDIRNTESVEFVIQEGEILSADTLRPVF